VPGRGEHWRKNGHRLEGLMARGMGRVGGEVGANRIGNEEWE
jgi:hypothetical protein